MLTRKPGPQMEERRRSRRSPVSWPVRLWLGEDLFTPARAADISRAGLRLHAASVVSTTLLHVGHSYRLELCPGYAENIVCLAEVRYLDEHSVGLWITGTLVFGGAGGRLDCAPAREQYPLRAT